MRIRYTKDRRRDLQEFVYKYRKEIAAFQSLPARDHELEEWINRVPRVELEYSKSTYFFDIYMTLKRTYKKLFNDGKIDNANA